MKIKVIILVMFMLLLCGCNAEVDIKVDRYSIDETIKINDYANEYYTKTMVFNKYRRYIPVDNSIVIVDTEPDERKSKVDYYDRTHVDLGTGYNFIYKYNYDFDEYKDASSVNHAFKSSYMNYDRTEQVLILSTDTSGIGFFDQYKDLTSIKINLQSNYKVLESNADSHKGDTYTWNMDRNSKKGIYIKYKVGEKKPVIEEEPEEEEPVVEEPIEEEEGISSTLALIALGVCILGFIVIVIVITGIDKRKYR